MKTNDKPNFGNYEKGLKLIRQARWDEATQYFEQVVSSEPNSISYYNLGVSLGNKGELEGAEHAFLKSIEFDPNDIDANYRLCTALHTAKKARQTLDAASKLLKLYEKRPPDKGTLAQIHYWRGLAFEQIKEDENALASYRITVEYAKDNAASHFALAEAANKLGYIEEAIEHYQKSFQLYPENANALYKLGSLYRELRMFDEAEKHWLQYAEYHPENANVYLCLGILYAQVGRLQESLEAYKKSLSLEPERDDTYVSLGNTLFASNQIEEAIASYRQAIRLSPNDPITHNNLGCAYSKNIKTMDKAIDSYKQAIRLSPTNADFYLDLGRCFFAKKNYRDAQIAWRAVFDLDDEQAKAEANLLLAKLKG